MEEKRRIWVFHVDIQQQRLSYSYVKSYTPDDNYVSTMLRCAVLMFLPIWILFGFDWPIHTFIFPDEVLCFRDDVGYRKYRQTQK